MTPILVGLYSGFAQLVLLAVMGYTLHEIYIAFEAEVTGFWSTLHAVRSGILWVGWSLGPFGILSLLFVRTPKVRLTRSYDLQHVTVATGAIAVSGIGMLFMSYDLLPFTKSDPRLFFAAVPAIQLLACVVTYEFWRLSGGSLRKGERMLRSTAVAPTASRKRHSRKR